ncbi:hypothetical protein CLAFUW4_08170 [Fulvia fulva]|uniref:Uncharacterized protein n=1 Tax=Passalora fulva TaxID=5499 RepID=A0A9Q8LDR2_PASFU|nr:uncharacterized protein CLAFUR5_08284 [Fulvia fulva]KAK4628976.1 hypothetical protein CLAFUR4_08175 [Fulvia fulva]KAK4630277.1 hypothetical protein CLAFUR0_08170 [Fulvia fulva]UJO15620.1 hypothetical protein CLAFUR5_08284 [Fulvia fulva]WPV12680.1 hypothetical protein CLAFUW4_08170 [Fulvia fulva]WPV27424.1 hypothetical protein CLAFUW7_08170 [Fulvia fulva]
MADTPPRRSRLPIRKKSPPELRARNDIRPTSAPPGPRFEAVQRNDAIQGQDLDGNSNLPTINVEQMLERDAPYDAASLTSADEEQSEKSSVDQRPATDQAEIGAERESDTTDSATESSNEDNLLVPPASVAQSPTPASVRTITRKPSFSRAVKVR